MPTKSRTRKSATKPHSLYTRMRERLARYVVMGESESVIAAVWTIGTHCFSPEATRPATYPYLYVTGGAGSGKTHLCDRIIGDVARLYKNAAYTTGAALFRMLGTQDPETGEVTNNAPTLFVDEADMVFDGNKNTGLQAPLNVGYTDGATIDRAFGKITIPFPVYGPKMLGGIDNGHLPETVTSRSIRIPMHMATEDELQNLEEYYVWEVKDDNEELYADMAQWARDNSLILRDYKPQRIPEIKPRQWEIARSMIQLGKALNVEDEVRRALIDLFSRTPDDGKSALYRSILSAFDSMSEEHAARGITSAQIMAQLAKDDVHVPGDSMTGLSKVLANDGIAPKMIRFSPSHPGVAGKKTPTQRGYTRAQFEFAFTKYIPADDDNGNS